jgi:hypothetical protein
VLLQNVLMPPAKEGAMTLLLTPQFNSKAKIDRREDGESETFGGKSLSRYFCGIALRQARRKEEPAVVAMPVIQPAPVLIRRGMNI